MRQTLWAGLACAVVIAATAMLSPSVAAQQSDPLIEQRSGRAAEGDEATRAEAAEVQAQLDSDYRALKSEGISGPDRAATSAALDTSACRQSEYIDPLFDVIQLDISVGGMNSCSDSSLLVFAMGTWDTWPDALLQRFEIAIDTDGNSSNGCGGADFEIIAWYDFQLGLVGVLYRVPTATCTIAQWIPVSSLFVDRVSSNDFIGVAVFGEDIGRPSSLRWVGWLCDAIDLCPGGVDVDRLPNSGWLNESILAAPAPPPPPPAATGGRTYYLSNGTTGGPADIVFTYGRAEDVVLVGDWDGDGRDTLGVRRDRTYYLTNGTTGGPADVVFTYGRAEDVVLVGDWDGDGRDTLGVRRGNVYFLTNGTAGGPADIVFGYGKSNDVIVVGDWDGDRRDTLGVRRSRTYFLTNGTTGGPADVVFTYGLADDVVLVGDWDGDVRDTLGVRR